MAIPTEPIGSIPRPAQLIQAGHDLAAGRITAADYARLAEAAVRETIEQLEATGSPVITDGEQGKPSFATYPLAGLSGLAPDGVVTSPGRGGGDRHRGCLRGIAAGRRPFP
jgi:5-methyltetrahydropteroyltriglutamate--homocysteine methyltransferase